MKITAAPHPAEPHSGQPAGPAASRVALRAVPFIKMDGLVFQMLLVLPCFLPSVVMLYLQISRKVFGPGESSAGLWGGGHRPRSCPKD